VDAPVVSALEEHHNLFLTPRVSGPDGHLPGGTEEPDHVRVHEGNA